MSGASLVAEVAACLEAQALGRPLLVSLVGGGGKTTLMFALARHWAGRGLRVLASTTTRILNPETASPREGRGFGRLVLREDPTEAAKPGPDAVQAALRDGECRLVLGQKLEGDKLIGIPALLADQLAPLFDACIVEADGSRGLPVKAPAQHEPVIPQASTTVIAVLGLEALGTAMDSRSVHRPEIFSALTGCQSGQRIDETHLLGLIASPAGLFKGSPASAGRILLLNKADLADDRSVQRLVRMADEAGCVDKALWGSLGPEAEGLCP